MAVGGRKGIPDAFELTGNDAKGSGTGGTVTPKGILQEARQTLQRGADLALVIDRLMWRPSLQAWLGTSAAALGDFAAAEGSWDEALATALSIGNHFGEAGILQKRDEASAQRGDHVAALADFAASAAILEELGAGPRLARVLRGWGETLRAAGRMAESDTTLRRSLSLFEEMGSHTRPMRSAPYSPRKRRTPQVR